MEMKVRNNYVTLPIEHFARSPKIKTKSLDKMLHGDENACRFSSYEKFIDFFRHIFTKRSKIEDYKKTYALLSSDNRGLIDKKYKNWQPIFGLAKLIDLTDEQSKQKYKIIIAIKNSDNTSTLHIKYNQTIISETTLPDDQIEFLKTHFFNENNGEITKPLNKNVTTLGLLKEIYTRYKKDALEKRHIVREESISIQSEENSFNSFTAQQRRRNIEISQINKSHKLILNKSECSDESQYNKSLLDIQPIDGEEGFFNQSLLNKIQCIDEFQRYMSPLNIDTIKKIGESIGKGSYGNAFKIGNFVVKIYHGDICKHNPWSEPNRVCKYLNDVNNDKTFARAVTVQRNNHEPVDILITKYIEGEDIQFGTEDYQSALKLLKQRGITMYDANIKGNIKLSNNEIYFIDGDLIVKSAERRKRGSVVSLATDELDSFINEYYPRTSETES